MKLYLIQILIKKDLFLILNLGFHPVNVREICIKELHYFVKIALYIHKKIFFLHQIVTGLVSTQSNNQQFQTY
jgi:hypothetical protein